MKNQFSIVVVFFSIFSVSIVFAQNDMEEFLKHQPIIDMHFHITKGFNDNEVYTNRKPDIDRAKLDWVLEDYTNNNVVLVLGGGTEKYATLYANADPLFWTGLIFPCMKTVKQDEPCNKEFLSETELRELYKKGEFKSLGESMFNYYGIPPNDKRLEPYWKVAEELNIPVGIHADTGPRPERVNKEERPNYNPEYANPALLKPILEKHPNLKLYLMHYGGGYSEQSLELMKLYPQIYCEISAVSMFAPKKVWEPRVKKLFDEGLGDRLMFASDYFGTVRKNIEIIFELEWLTEQQKRDIYYNNAARFLNLSKSEINAHHNKME